METIELTNLERRLLEQVKAMGRESERREGRLIALLNKQTGNWKELNSKLEDLLTQLNGFETRLNELSLRSGD